MWVSCTIHQVSCIHNAPGCWALRLAASRVLPGLEEAVRASWVYPQKVLVIYVFLLVFDKGRRVRPPSLWPTKRIPVGVCLQRVFFLIPFVPRLARACHTSERLGGSPRGAGRGDARG